MYHIQHILFFFSSLHSRISFALVRWVRMKKKKNFIYFNRQKKYVYTCSNAHIFNVLWWSSAVRLFCRHGTVLTVCMCLFISLCIQYFVRSFFFIFFSSSFFSPRFCFVLVLLLLFHFIFFFSLAVHLLRKLVKCMYETRVLQCSVCSTHTVRRVYIKIHVQFRYFFFHFISYVVFSRLRNMELKRIEREFLFVDSITLCLVGSLVCAVSGRLCMCMNVLNFLFFFL